MTTYPCLQDFKKLIQKSPITRGCIPQIEMLQARYGEQYLDLAERILRQMDLLHLDSVQLFTRYIIDYLREMHAFLKTGSYGHDDYTKIKSTIYDNDNVMMNTYLPGLFLAYGFTSILYSKYHVFRNSFLPRLAATYSGIEVGFGEGFYLWELARHVPGISFQGFDISQSAINFANNLLTSSGVTGFKLSIGNIFEGLPVADASQDFGILAEVIEHIPDPQKGIAELSRLIRSGGYFYCTTVIDSNHMDHITNFKTPKIVEELLKNTHFSIIDSIVYTIKEDFPAFEDKSIGLAFVCQKD